MWFFEQQERPAGPKYPKGSYIVMYGKYSNNDALTFKSPCGSAGEQEDSSVFPSCFDSLRALEIAWNRDLTRLGHI
jgi:hypothetical protein